jgi:hypothetical protein
VEWIIVVVFVKRGEREREREKGREKDGVSFGKYQAGFLEHCG